MAKEKLTLNCGIEEINHLGTAILLRAVRDYCHPEATKETRIMTNREREATKNKILKDLKGTWLNALTNGIAAIVAEQLEQHGEEIKERLKYTKDEEVA
jgi:hypothetical protein